MLRSKKAKQSVSAHVTLSVEELEPRLNARSKITRESLSELTQSIKQTGITTPLLVRPFNGHYQIVDGERRWRAAKYAKLTQAPVYIRELTDEEASYAAATANLQRENLHPLDEAEEFRRLIDARNGDVAGVARKLGKSEKYVARRLALTEMIGLAREDFLQSRIGLEHALELARLPREIQPAALEVCYQTVWTPEGSKANRDAPPRHVSNLKSWIEQYVLLNIGSAPFRLDDDRLREDGRTCVDCPQRTGQNHTLFADLAAEADTCVNRECFNQKAQAFVQIEARRIAPKHSQKPAPILAPYYGYKPDPQAQASGLELLPRENFHPIASSGEKCANAERGVWGVGASVGKTTWLCRNPECPDHAGAVRPSRGGAGATRDADADQKKNARRQELFDIKVAEETRRRVFIECLKTYRYPLEFGQQQFVAAAHFERIPTEHRKVLCSLMGWEHKDLTDFTDSKREKKLVKLIEAMDEHDLAGFMVLMSFIHFGANSHGGHFVKQTEVERLAKEREVNYALIEAGVRLERSPKKYRPAHERYLRAVEGGEKAAKPKVYEPAVTSTAQALKPAPAEGEQASTKTTHNDGGR
jgi:ParB/RepB/Spo0J family partition protein